MTEKFQKRIRAIVSHAIAKHDSIKNTDVLTADEWVTIDELHTHNLTKPLPVKYYSRHLFCKMRKTCHHIDVQQIISNAPIVLSKSTGKSGALLAFATSAQHGSVVIKTVKKSECKFVRKWLNDYVAHWSAANGTLLNCYLAMFKFRYQGTMVRICIMNNVLRVPTGWNITNVYDLKGSVIGREATEEEKAKNSLKDVDLMEKKVKLGINATDCAALEKQLQMDVQFLSQNNIMDYSLLLAQCTCSNTSNSKPKQVNFFTSQSAPQTAYVMGIIDITQQWNLAKVGAMAVKSIRHERAKLSTVPPMEYAGRFEKFVKSILQ